MASSVITNRLANQQIAGTAFKTPVELLHWMAAMQAQDFGMAKWAIGLRLPHLHDADIDKAFSDGTILRTHILRPTWHFVNPADIRWMITLTAPRIHSINAHYYKKFELDAKVFNKCNDIFAKALEGGKYSTRNSLVEELTKHKITADGVRLTCIMMHAELDGIICSGPREGKQFTYALFNERVPPTKAITQQEALVELTTRYFASRSPATVQDFSHWSGLSATDAKEGINLLKDKLVKENIDGVEYWIAQMAPHHTNTAPTKLQQTFLMPDYDEYAISYKHRDAILGEKKKTGNVKNDNPLFYHTLIVDGLAAGTWQRVVKGGKTTVEITATKPLNKTKQQAVDRAVKKYLAFMERKQKDKK